MALVAGSEAFVSFKDAAGRLSEWSQRITEASAKLYAAAADETARNATAVGTLLTRVQVLSELTMVKKGIRYQYVENAPTLPTEDSGKLRGNKIIYQFSGSGRNFVTSIPGRNNSVLTLVDGTTIVVEDGGAMENLKTSLDLIGLDINGNALTVQGAYIND